VAPVFTAVQSAVIEAQTKKQNARTDRASNLPAAESTAADRLAAATKYAVDTRAAAEADATAFGALAAEYRRNPAVVRERLYRDAVAPIIASAAKRQFLPPPAGDRYSGLRIEVPPESFP
jgi:membrane protease subunit HflK